MDTSLSVLQYGIADMVCLEGATLHEVSGGGTKNDFKRAFAVVESTGNIHVLVARCEGEYITWVTAILYAISAHSTNDSKAISDESLLASIDDSTNNDRGQLGRSIAKVVQATKIKGQAAIARSIKPTGLVSDSDLAPDRATVLSTKSSEPLTISGGSTNVGAAPRIHQIRNRLAGVSQVTKGRIGTSFAAAKQKGKEAMQRRLLSTGNGAKEAIDSSSTATVEFYPADATPETWECIACLRLNTVDVQKCETCECVRSDRQTFEETGTALNLSNMDEANNVDDVDHPQIITKEGNQRHHENTEVDDQSLIDSFEDDDDHKSKSSIKQRFSSVVRRAKIATSGPQMFGRQIARPENQQDSLAGTVHGQRVTNIALNGPLRVPMYPLGLETNQRQDLPMKKLKGSWSISVDLHRAARLENGSTSQNDRENNSSIPTALHSTNIRQTNSDEESAFTDQTSDLTSVRDDEYQTNAATMNQLVDLVFKIKVVKHPLVGVCTDPTEFTRTLSEISVLHMTVSESISQLPHYKFKDVDADGELGTVETPSISLYSPSFLDNVLTSGRILGDILIFLQSHGDTHHDSISNYSGKCVILGGMFLSSANPAHPDINFVFAAVFIEAFLNEIVSAPLPGDCLETVKCFLELSDDSLNSARASMNLNRLHKDNDSPISNILTDGLKSISQFSAELDKACDQNLQTIRILERIYNKVTATEETAPPSATQRSTLSTPSNQRSDGLSFVLNEMMRERDEAQSRLTLAEILHRNEKDELQNRVIDLTSQLETAKHSQIAPIDKNLNDEKAVGATNSRHHENKAIYDSDLELQSLCQQLAGEISARTAAELSIVRMKEIRKLEQEREALDQQALQNEVVQLRELVQQLSAREAEMTNESRTWRESFETLVQYKAENTTAHPSSISPK